MNMTMTDKDTVSLFQERRRETWNIIRPWVFVTLATFAVVGSSIAYHELFSDLWRLICIFGGFPVLFLSIGRISLTVNRLYRCPACASVPRSRGILVDPDDCPTCGAPLR
jgi:hypothetical protein